MLIGLYLFIVNVALPQLRAYAQEFVDLIMICILTVAGIILLFGAVGMKISNNLGSTIVSGVFRAIGYLFRTLIRAIGWVVRGILRLIPRVFEGSRRAFRHNGMTNLRSNILAFLVTLFVIILII